MLLGRQIELRVGWIEKEILPPSRTVARPPDVDLAEDRLKRPLMATLDVGPPRPVATDHQLQARLAGGAQIEMPNAGQRLNELQGLYSRAVG